jgi:uncharacterized YigZ family protein
MCKNPKEGLTMVELIEKKSRFAAYGARIESEMEAKVIIESLKKEHKRSSHIAYAYVVDGIEKYCDAGEPRGTAGQPLISAIKRRNLENVVVVVVRYFGGTLLGKGGLIRAYGRAAGMELDTIIEHVPPALNQVHYESSKINLLFNDRKIKTAMDYVAAT